MASLGHNELKGCQFCTCSMYLQRAPGHPRPRSGLLRLRSGPTPSQNGLLHPPGPLHPHHPCPPLCPPTWTGSSRWASRTANRTSHFWTNMRMISKRLSRNSCREWIMNGTRADIRLPWKPTLVTSNIIAMGFTWTKVNDSALASSQ